MGGRAVFTFKKTDKGYESICESKMMGKWETKMEFNDEGINCVSIMSLQSIFKNTSS